MVMFLLLGIFCGYVVVVEQVLLLLLFCSCCFVVDKETVLVAYVL
jgi:hypothetical protein